jgi:hypothetical protein
MMVHARIFGRDDFLRVLGMHPNAWNQRSYQGETALAFGLAKPGHMNEYGPLDLVAVALTQMITNSIKIDMKVAAGLVRKHWQEWLDGLARAERSTAAASNKRCFFVVATNSDKTKVFAAIDVLQKAIDKVDGPDMVPFCLPLQLVLNKLRAAAKAAKVDLPKLLTPDPDTEAYDEWLEAIEEHRQAARMKAKAKTKAKRAKANKPAREKEPA